MTFLRYITRHSGLGRTGWFAAIVIHAFAALWLYLHWISAIIGLAMLVAFWGGTWSNYRRDNPRKG